MKEKKYKIIIILLCCVITLLLVTLLFVTLKGNSEKNETETEYADYSDPLEYFEDVDKSNDENKIKKGFTSVVDFLFYGKEIKGKTLQDLTDDAKLKIMKIALSIDQKIEDKFPDYKEKISDKYKEIKSKVVESYINTTNKICDKHEELCIDAKNDFNSLKESFGITFDYIKKYGIKGIDKIREWYVDFRD